MLKQDRYLDKTMVEHNQYGHLLSTLLLAPEEIFTTRIYTLCLMLCSSTSSTTSSISFTKTFVDLYVYTHMYTYTCSFGYVSIASFWPGLDPRIWERFNMEPQGAQFTFLSHNTSILMYKDRDIFVVCNYNWRDWNEDTIEFFCNDQPFYLEWERFR